MVELPPVIELSAAFVAAEVEVGEEGVKKAGKAWHRSSASSLLYCWMVAMKTQEKDTTAVAAFSTSATSAAHGAIMDVDEVSQASNHFIFIMSLMSVGFAI